MGNPLLIAAVTFGTGVLVGLFCAVFVVVVGFVFGGRGR